MKKYVKEIIILLIQLLIFYMLPLFAGSTDAMGMVFLIILSTFVLSTLVGGMPNKKVKYFYPIVIAMFFIPSVFIYYNESAFIHSIWYLVISTIGILTSWFPNDFNNEIAQLMKKFIKRRTKFAFIVSEFEKNHEKTDQYFKEILELFQNIGIDFEKSYVIDGRMEKEVAKDAVRAADVVWLSDGDTPTQYQYLLKYELIDILREHSGMII